MINTNFKILNNNRGLLHLGMPLYSFMKGAKRISIKDIAALTKTSVTTVSQALNGKGRISTSIVKKIVETALANGYQPNRLAVGLRTGTSKVIGVILESVGGPFFGQMAKVIENEAEKAGYGVIYSCTHNDSVTAKKVIDMMSNQFVDGYIIVPLVELQSEIEQLTRSGKPVVLIDGYYPDRDVPYVTVNNYESSYRATDSLISSGYKDIALIEPNLELPQLHDRRMGFLDCLVAAGLSSSDINICRIPFESTRFKAVQTVRNFLANQKPEAVFSSTNYVGSLVLEAIKNLKLGIPDEIGLITFDDNELFEMYPPGINAIKQPTYDIAKSAIDILLSKLDDPTLDITKIRVEIPAEYMKRGSIN